MKEIKLNLDKSKKYVVACSFGPDSMALLFSAIKDGLSICVAHVNYRKRKASQFEQENLSVFCTKHNLKLYILDLKDKQVEGNFQDWARKVRYEFFNDVAKKERADAVLVAHQEDDLIETYLMQKNRRNYVKNYGISRENEIFGVKIIRPLLGYSKKCLQQFDEENGVPFSIDESNLTDHYSRNKIRHSIVEKLSEGERRDIVESIQQSNKTQLEIRTHYSKDEFLNFTYDELIQIFDKFMQITEMHKDISKKYLNEIKSAFKNKTNLRFKITDLVWVEKDYEDVFVLNAAKIKSFCFEFNEVFANEFLDIDFSCGANDRGIEKLPNKLYVKNCKNNDKVIINNYSSSINRLFIDWKMPLFLREVWPGIYDENGNLIYVPRYRKIFKDEHTSKFKINTEYFYTF